MSESSRTSWNEHWDAIRSRSSVFGRIASIVRKQVLGRALAYYASRYLSGDGPVLEAGCGSGQSSSRIRREGRARIGLDFSALALREARSSRAFDALVQGDILQLPFRDASVSGLWNLGVMEHFEEASGIRILREFRRVLAPGSHVVLFWPPTFGSSRLVLAPIEALRSRRRGSPFRFFPDEVNLLTSRAHARRILAAAGLEERRVDFSARDLFIHVVVVARRPS